MPGHGRGLRFGRVRRWDRGSPDCAGPCPRRQTGVICLSPSDPRRPRRDRRNGLTADRREIGRVLGRWVFAGLFVVAGVGHFAATEFFTEDRTARISPTPGPSSSRAASSRSSWACSSSSRRRHASPPGDSSPCSSPSFRRTCSCSRTRRNSPCRRCCSSFACPSRSCSSSGPGPTRDDDPLPGVSHELPHPPRRLDLAPRLLPSDRPAIRPWPASDGSSSWATASPTRASTSSTSKPTCGSTTPRSAASSSTSACPARRSRASPSRATPGASSPGPTSHERLDRVLARPSPTWSSPATG